MEFKTVKNKNFWIGFNTFFFGFHMVFAMMGLAQKWVGGWILFITIPFALFHLSVASIIFDQKQKEAS